ncbi:gliding motility-associated C-terminal domain-containing protein [Flavobacterium sp. CS20]|uniref:T9SS type B sorting domain-containing protein n=1 Tax=Flavobacterium sp. CS20 TaxID=2775246 RepID=UPI001B3A3341|nr:gliding motility-associated C-terminal domain-containing protein [Flavobacterium sp. CS20]QTY26291.1 gliding motility-associated C-terminal domain-containing protein [Flavobacterium sp. CS20]
MPGDTGETTPSIELSQSGTVTLTTSFKGCDEVATETFTLFNNPQVDIAGSAVICQGDTNTLDATPSNNADLASTNFTWSKDGTEIAGETNATLDITDGGLYEVSVDNNGCLTTDQIQVDLVDYQVSLPIPPQTCVDAGETVLVSPEFTGLTQNEIEQVTYQWSAGENTPTIELTQGETVTLTTSFNGCDEIVTETFTLFNNPQVDIAGSAVICDGDTNTLDATPMNLNDLDSPTYAWTKDGAALPGETNPTLDITDGGVYEVTIDNNGCTSTDQIQVELVSYTLDLGGDQNLCTGDGGPQNITLTPTVTGLTSAQENQIFYTWSDGSTEETLTVSESGTYTLETDVNGCVQTAQVTVNVVETIDVSLQDVMKCAEDEVVLNTGLTNNDPNVSYSWTLNGNPIGDNNPSITASEEGTYVITVNNQGCESTATAEVTNYDVDNCVITQGISPGQDGFNDCMDLTWLDDQLGIDRFQVFNRYGKKVFDESNYTKQFCGQDDDGDELSTGTYFYVINLANSDQRFGRVVKGWVYINLEQ